MKPVIFGLEGLTLSESEISFFKESDPAGYILFLRNIDNREQLRALTDSLRNLHGRNDLPILIDQEGGRVVRMKAPVWPSFPTWEKFDRLYDVAPASAIEAARVNAEALACDLHEMGVSVNCLPLLDVRQPDAHDIIGDRALGSEPMRVAAMGRAVLDGMARAGVVGVVKHIPGHGRAYADSHLELPVVDATDEELSIDLAPFEALKDAAMGMTAHIVYTAWDEQECASLSPTIIEDIIRKRIGFDGLLMSDDLDMKALKGDIPQLAADVVAAGCDLALNCWGRMDEMVGIAEKLSEITPGAKTRLNRAMASVEGMSPQTEFAALVDKRDQLLALA